MPARWRTLSFFLNAAVALVLLVGSSNAQTPDTAADPQVPAHVAYVEGAVTLEREGQAELASVNVPIVAGDRIATAGGRVEIVFPDGTVLDVDESSVIEFLSAGLLRLSEGRVLLTVPGVNDPTRAPHYQIDTPVASLRTDSPGEFRIATSGARDTSQTELAVLRGYATLVTDRGATSIRAGEKMVAFDNGSISSTLSFNSARFDAFDRWTAERREARVGTQSAQYLPNDLRMYSGTFDRNGSWQYDVSYGYVWYPTVDATWQPYYDGYWSPMRSYGWTWIGATVWSWPTHHYGRWGHTRGSWFWIPGRTWGPSWVSWASAPGYVSWCPLGFDSRPVFGLSAGVNGAPAGWVVVPQTSFGYRGYSVTRHAVSPVHLPRATTFTALQTAPVDSRRRLRRIGETSSANGVAAQRQNTPLRSVPESVAAGGGGTSAVRRAIPADPAGVAPESFTRRRAVPADPSSSLSNVRQHSPDTIRTFGDRESFVRPAPTAPDAPFTRTPGGPEAAFPRTRTAPPTGSLTETRPPAIPTPPPMPRWAPPNNTQAELPRAMPFPRPLPQTMAPAVPAMPVPSSQPAEPPQSRPTYPGPRFRAAPAAAPAQNRGSSGADSSFGGMGGNQPAAASQPTASGSQPTGSASQPSAGSTRAVPRSDGQSSSGGSQSSSGSGGGRRR